MVPVPRGLSALPAQLSGAVQAVGRPGGHGSGCAMATPWNGELPGLPEGCGAGELRAPERERAGRGMRSLRLGRLGGCLSLAGIMSSECNASAYE